MKIPLNKNFEDFFHILNKNKGEYLVKDLKEDDFSKEEIIYQIGISPNRIDIINKIKGVNFKTAWKRKKYFFYGKEKVWVIDKKDLIRNKKILGREQDIWHLKKLKEV